MAEEKHLPVWKTARFGRRYLVAAIVLLLSACGRPPISPPEDAQFDLVLTANKKCLEAMASRLIDSGRNQSLRVMGLPEIGISKVEVEGPVGEPKLWEMCLSSTSIQKVEHDSWAESVAEMRGQGEVVQPNASDHAIWFTVFQGLLTGGIEKGLLYVSNDSVDGAGKLVASIDGFASRTVVPEHGYLFRRLDRYWYIYYIQH